jgi:hypothetical protein
MNYLHRFVKLVKSCLRRALRWNLALFGCYQFAEERFLKSALPHLLRLIKHVYLVFFALTHLSLDASY